MVDSIEIEDNGPGIPEDLQENIFFPLVTSIFLAVHFWRIRRDGFSGPAL